MIRDLRTAIGAGIVAVVAIAALTAPWLSPHDPNIPDFAAALAPPGASHWFGADDLGRDTFSRIVHGARASLMVGFLSVAGALILGTALGLTAGYFGGLADTAIMRVMDVLFAFPGILLALGITAALGPSLGNAILAIAVVNLPIFARLARSQALVIRSLDYVEARRALGFGPVSILFSTVLPNAMGPIVVQASLLFASAIITESYLSFLGLGVQPPTPTWGNMLRGAIGFLDMSAWLAWFPGIAIFATVLGFNLLGDGLRDRLDPRS
jgi:peptide/nickel transport system permease protein